MSPKFIQLKFNYCKEEKANFSIIQLLMSTKYRPILQVLLEETRETGTSFANLDGMWKNAFFILMGVQLFERVLGKTDTNQ